MNELLNHTTINVGQVVQKLNTEKKLNFKLKILKFLSSISGILHNYLLCTFEHIMQFWSVVDLQNKTLVGLGDS